MIKLLFPTEALSKNIAVKETYVINPVCLPSIPKKPCVIPVPDLYREIVDHKIKSNPQMKMNLFELVTNSCLYKNNKNTAISPNIVNQKNRGTLKGSNEVKGVVKRVINSAA
jgi:hypothetical protein